MTWYYTIYDPVPRMDFDFRYHVSDARWMRCDHTLRILSIVHAIWVNQFCGLPLKYRHDRVSQLILEVVICRVAIRRQQAQKVRSRQAAKWHEVSKALPVFLLIARLGWKAAPLGFCNMSMIRHCRVTGDLKILDTYVWYVLICMFDATLRLSGLTNSLETLSFASNDKGDL